MKGYNQASLTNTVREDANEVQSPRKRQPPHPSQGESLWAVPTVPDEPLFLAGEIAGREDEKLARAQRDASLTLRSLRRLPGSVLGAAITRDYTEQGVTSLIGQTIRTGQDLAILAQIYRNPSFETFRVFFTKNNQIVGQNGVSSRLPGSSAIFAGKDAGFADGVEAINREAAQLGADGIWILHNHPSGNPSPSDADIRVTQHLSANLSVPVQNHVIIDQTRYAEIDPYTGAAATHSMPDAVLNQPSRYDAQKTPAIPHGLLGRQIDGYAQLVAVAQELRRDDDQWFEIVGTNRAGVRAITTVPVSLLQKSPLRLTAELRRIARATGSVSLFAVNVPESKVDFYLLDKAIESGLLVDAQIRDKPDSYIATQPPMQVTGTMGSAKNRGTPVSDEAVPYTPRASNVPGNDQRFAAATPATLTATLKAISSDATVQALIDNGRLKVVAKQAELPRHAAIPPGQRVAGWVDPQTGVVYLIADNITQAEVDGLLDHEIGVHQTQLMLKQPKPLALRFAHGLLRLIGAKGLLGDATFNDVLAQLERMRAAGNVRVVQAFADAKAAGGKLNQSPRLLAEEALAYLTQNHPQLPLIQRLMAMIRAALYRAGFKMNLTEADLHALAKSAVRWATQDGQIGAVTPGVFKGESAASLVSRFKNTGFVSNKDILGILGEYPDYLNSVADYILSQHQKLVEGRVSPRDVAKAYLLTLASQRSDAISPAIIQAKTGFVVPARFIDQNGRVRPEEAVAAWLLSPNGKKALDSIEQGNVDADLWEEGLKVRDSFGANAPRSLAFTDREYLRNVKGTMQMVKRGGDNLKELLDVTDRINAAKGDSAQLDAALAGLNGIGAGKTGFVKHFLGLGDSPTIDAVEINTWLTGQGSTKGVDSEAALLAREFAGKMSDPLLGAAFVSRVSNRFNQLRLKSKIPSQYRDSRVFQHLMHHWLWDRAKGIETTHAGLYEAMQRAAQASEDVEAQRQYDAVVAKYKGTPEWMKAPNGQPTKLTERQWVQVRTPNFKRWFGNFAFDENESVPVIDVATDALEGVDLKSADSVREWLLSSSDFTTPATNAHSGLLVEFSRKNLKASLKRRGVEHRQAYSVLRRLIETARLTDYEESNRPGLAGQDIYYAALRLPNGNVIGVRIKADVRHNRRTSYKDHRIDDVVTQIQVTPAAFDGSLAGIVNIRSTGHPQSGVTVRLGALVGADKPVSSKTVDENGEPMVAHHGTSGEFFEFDRNKLGENTENAGNKLGFFFTDRDYVADSYSLWSESRTGKPAKVVSAFVSMANPYYAEAGSLDRLAPNSPDKEEELARLKEIKDSGEYDGIVFSTKHNGTEYVAFSPTQIKSAIGNTGAFSPTNRDIRYARALGESNPTLTADEVLAMIDAGQEVTNEEFAFLQAYLAGASKKLGVDAPSFNAWFGASKIVDRAGKPLKMYHATTANFTVFDANRAGGNTTHPTAGLGFFFTNNRSHAAAKYGDNVMETYLTIEKPYRLTDADLRRMDGPEAAKAFRQQLEAKGYDGVILDELGSTKYVAAFYPDQIKLTENETYTKGEQDVRFAIAQPAPGTPPQVDPPPMTRITWASAKGAKGCPLIT